MYCQAFALESPGGGDRSLHDSFEHHVEESRTRNQQVLLSEGILTFFSSMLCSMMVSLSSQVAGPFTTYLHRSGLYGMQKSCNKRPGCRQTTKLSFARTL